MFRIRHAKEVFSVSKNVDFSLSERSIFSAFGFGKKSEKKNCDDVSDPCGKFENRGRFSKEGSRHNLKNLCLPKVIIIGGGLSGMSAAECLIKAGINDIMILEASDRPGGRIYSTWLSDTNVELGPTEFTGASMANPLFNMANAAKANVEKVKPAKSVFLTSDGRFITDYGMEKLIFDEILEDTRVTGKCRLKTSLLQFFSLRVQQQLLRLPSFMRFDAERVLYGMMNSMRGSYGTSISNLSAASLGQSDEKPGGTVRVKSGMGTILTLLTIAIPHEQFLICKAVEKVMNVDCPEPGKRVKVVCSDGDSYNADYVISTVPLGVLKAKGSKMFAGNLNKKKQNAIDKIGCGLRNNIFFEFSQPWWPPGQCGIIRLAWSAEEMENHKSWTKGISQISEVPGSTSLLRVVVAGSEAELIEKCPEEELALEFTTLMRKMMGDPSIPYPSSVLMSRWGCNPLSRGATVFIGVNTTPGMFNDLAGGNHEDSSGLPLSPVLFAGDATVPKYFGTLVGARISGVREATRIIEAVKRGAVCCDESSDDDEPQQQKLICEGDEQQKCRN